MQDVHWPVECRGKHRVAHHPISRAHRPTPVGREQKRAVERPGRTEEVWVLRRDLYRLEAAQRKSVHGASAPGGDYAETRFYYGNQLIDEVILEASGANAGRPGGQ